MTAYGDNIKIFCGNSNPQFAETICKSLSVPLGQAEVKTFADGEVSVSLNETCRFLWEQFKRPRTIYDVYVAAKEEFQDSTGRMLGGILSFVKEYLNVGLLKEE